MTEANEQPELLDRRSAIKKAAAAGAAAGLLWTAPKVEGLTLRPSYAAAQSAGGLLCFDFAASANFFSQSNALCPSQQPNGRFQIQWQASQGRLSLTVAPPTNGGTGTVAVTPLGFATITDANTNPSGGGFRFSANGLGQDGQVTIKVPYNCA